MKENPTPLPRPPDQDILRHEQMRMIESQVYSLEKRLKSEGKEPGQIQSECDQLRNQLTIDLERGVHRPKTDQSSKLEKQAHMEVFKQALKISEDHKFGEAFDLELQE